MRRAFVRSALFGATLFSFSSASMASVVVEAAGNGSLATAQDLSGNFSLDSETNITNSTTIPHATVVSSGIENEYDYYTFTVAIGGTAGIFDIDAGWDNSLGYNNAGSFDSFLALYAMDGTLLAVNDDALLDTGSQSGLDSYLTYNFANAGTYAIRVGSCCTDANFQYRGQQYNGSYDLHVSLEAPGATGAVPEPGTWAMMLMGFGAMGMSFKRRRKLAFA